MTNYASGHAAEKTAADYLKKHGFAVLELNWKTRYCEIDIVALKDKTIYFVEVKSRMNALYGSGLDYITPKKLNRMRFAAEVWIQTKQWKGNYRLAALSLDGPAIAFVDEL